MFINKLNQLYKPKRILYYVNATNEDIEAYYKGIINEDIRKLTNAFGTYDYPGVFFSKTLGKD